MKYTQTCPLCDEDLVLFICIYFPLSLVPLISTASIPSALYSLLWSWCHRTHRSLVKPMDCGPLDTVVGTRLDI